MKIIYGASSAAPANTRLTNGYLLYDWVMRKSCFPSFWGRTLDGAKPITTAEIEFLKSKHCKIACILQDFSEEVISGNKGDADAVRAIRTARRLGIPRDGKIALFADIPAAWSINHNWMIGFAATLLKNGYIPGFIGNTDSSDNFNFDRQCSHFVQATGDSNNLNAVYWAKAPRYSFDPEMWAPYAPSALLPQDMHLWQYGTVQFHGLSADKSYARDPSVLQYFL